MRFRTERTYVHWIRRYILFHDKRHPIEMGEQEINAFLTHLATARRVSASTQTQALCAILFLYNNVLSREPQFAPDGGLASAGQGCRLLARRDHCAGRQRRESSKNDAASIQPALKAYIEKAATLHRQDLAEKYGRVYLPYALARKYPKAAFEWSGAGEWRQEVVTLPGPNPAHMHRRLFH